MGQFMIHVINSLKVNGKFSLVIDRGISMAQKIIVGKNSFRKWLLTCCDLNQIVLLIKGIYFN